MLFHPDTRKGFLEHMRNTSWLVIVLSLSIAMLATKYEFSNPIYRFGFTVLAIMFLLVWCYGTVASGLLFIEASLKNVVAAENELQALKEVPMTSLERIRAALVIFSAHWTSILGECVLAVLAVAVAGVISLVIGTVYGAKIVGDIRNNAAYDCPAQCR